MRGKSSTRKNLIQKYGAYFPGDADPLEIELLFIRGLGYMTDKRGKHGEGLPHHVKEAMKIIWPEPDIYWHKWNNILVDEFLRGPGRTGVFGPSNSQKSSTLSRAALTVWYARTHGTTVLISSTTLDALKKRIWDYVVGYDKTARLRYPELPGSLIESKLMLLADDSGTEGRSFKNGVVGVACFSPETLIDTPTGPKEIKSLKIGDAVVNATGVGRITEIHQRISGELLRVTLMDGRKIDCTKEHPFLTVNGWKKAGDLEHSDMVLSGYEVLHLLCSADCPEILEREILREVSQPHGASPMRSLRKNIPALALSDECGKEVLQPNMLQPVGFKQYDANETCHRLPILWEGYESSLQSALLFGSVSESSSKNAVPDLWKKLYINPRITSAGAFSVLQQSLSHGCNFKEKETKELNSNPRELTLWKCFPESHWNYQVWTGIQNKKGREGWFK